MLNIIFRVCLIYLLAGVVVLCYNRNRVYAEPEIKQYSDRFFAEAKARGVDIEPFYALTIEFSDRVIYPEAGVSYDSWSRVNKIIRLNSMVWSMLDDTERYELVAHELGHAVLHRGHDYTVLPNKQWMSIMGPSLIQSEYIKQNMTHYYKELFSKQGDLPK